MRASSNANKQQIGARLSMIWSRLSRCYSPNVWRAAGMRTLYSACLPSPLPTSGHDYHFWPVLNPNGSPPDSGTVAARKPHTDAPRHVNPCPPVQLRPGRSGPFPPLPCPSRGNASVAEPHTWDALGHVIYLYFVVLHVMGNSGDALWTETRWEYASTWLHCNFIWHCITRVSVTF